MNKDQLISAIENKQAELQTKQKELLSAEEKLNHMQNDPAAYFDGELTELFDDWLNELYQDAFDALPITIGRGYAADIIKAEDPSYYREGYNNWLDDSDNYDLFEFDEYQEQSELVDQLNSDIEEIENEIVDLETDLEYLENDQIA